MIEFLPSNCQYFVGKLDEEINILYKELSRNHDDNFSLYMHLLPYVFEKCDYNVLQFIEIVMKTIKNKNGNKMKKLQELKLSKEYHILPYSVFCHKGLILACQGIRYIYIC